MNSHDVISLFDMLVTFGAFGSKNSKQKQREKHTDPSFRQ